MYFINYFYERQIGIRQINVPTHFSLILYSVYTLHYEYQVSILLTLLSIAQDSSSSDNVRSLLFLFFLSYLWRQLGLSFAGCVIILSSTKHTIFYYICTEIQLLMTLYIYFY